MDPFSSETFSWKHASDDLEGFAQSLGITLSAEHDWPGLSSSTGVQPPQNPEHLPAFHPDALRLPDIQAPPGSFYPSYPDDRSGFPQTSVPEHHPQLVDSFDPFGQSPFDNPAAHNERAAFAEPSGSQRRGPYDHIADFDVPSASQQFDQNYHTPAHHHPSASHQFDQNYLTPAYHHPSTSQPFDQNYQTPAYHHPSASQPFDQNYLTPAYHHPSASQPFDQNYHTPAYHHPYSSQQFDQNYQSPVFHDPSASQQFDQNYHTPTYHHPSASQQFNQNAEPFFPTEDEAHLTNPQSAETHPAAVYEPYGVYGPGESPSRIHTDEPSADVGSSHSQHFDHQRLQALEASLAVPFPRRRFGAFDDSVLSQSLRAFAKAKLDNFFRIAYLGKIDHELDRPAMLSLFNKSSPRKSLSSSIFHLNELVIPNNIGILEHSDARKTYRFTKGVNFHLFEIFFEAYSQIRQDLGIENIPLHLVQVIALLYGQPPQSRTSILKKLDMAKSTLYHIVSACNKLLNERLSPVSIVTSLSNENFYYSLALDKSRHGA